VTSTQSSEVEDFLSHYGVKGMRWGVRRADKKFEKNAPTRKTFVTVHSRAVDHYNTVDIPRINNKPEYKNADLLNPGPVRDKYHQEHQDAFLKAMDNAAKSMGTNRSGTREYSIVTDGRGNWGVRAFDIEHADSDILSLRPVLDNRGFILKIVIQPTVLKQDQMNVEDFLSHYGVRGMRWSVRKHRNEEARKQQFSKAEKQKRKEGKTAYQKAPNRLSDQELKDRIARMDLERRYSDLNSPQQSEGRKYARSIVEQVGRTATAGAAGAAITYFVQRELKRRFPTPS
jgi:hypothetical protein